ncbi:MAG: 23S rRNA (adenine(2503)-C(2))-methyltransferase RlmN [Candidatus Hydrogenedentes bacterium]|nr:23S rRNA (adenine(2503)-C(2))-methyltransferase RlmN [Candidatus Hydrogenedentota bacterium]
MTQDPIPLTDLLPGEIAAALGLKPFQGNQIFRWLHQKRLCDFDAMTNLAKPLRETLRARCIPCQIEPVKTSDSPGGTRKVLFRLRDGETIESVLLRDRDRVTLCLSTQVGCPIKCLFCATGQGGFARNLTPGEIVEQALRLLENEDLEGRTPNIVYMGMGEPFRNYDAVAKSIRLLMCPEGLGIGARRITISTAGDIPGIRRFAGEPWQVRLAVSLHAANDDLRSKLVPLNRKYGLRTLMATVRDYAKATGRQVSFEYVLLHGVNDSPAQARELAGLIRGLDAVVNLIAYNTVAGAEFSAPPTAVCETFKKALLDSGVKATLRQERGGDINAACGQLRRASKNNEKAKNGD